MSERSIRSWVKQLVQEANTTQQGRIRELEAQVAKLELQNARMKTAMRRCLTCDYRLEVLGKKRAERADDSPSG